MRGNDALLVVLLLLALSSSSNAAAPPRRLPAGKGKRNPGFDVYVEPSEESLLREPEEPSPDDLLWAQYVGDDRHAHPRPVDDKGPVRRKLSRFERWALGPYFPVAEDLEVDLVNGALDLPELRARMAELAKTQPELVRKALEEFKQMHAVTLAHPGINDGKPQIYFPRLAPLYNRWWLAILSHEVTHVAQARMGLTPAQSLQSMLEHGYRNSPVEKQARWKQREVLRGLTMRARNFYREKGEI